MFKAIFVFAPLFFAFATMVFFVNPAKAGRRTRMAWTAVLSFCAAKFLCFEAFGGDAFAPDLPEKLVWAWNWAYSGMCLLLGLVVALLPARPLFRRLLARRKWRLAWLAGLPAVAWCAAAVGVWNGVRPPRAVEVELAFEDLPPALDGYRVVLVSDLHASAAARRWRTESVVETANAADADLVCLAGDYVDGLSERRAQDVEPLRNLRARDGVYAVSGNHEYYFDRRGWRRKYAEWGIAFLENECVFPRKGLAVAGVPDFAAARFSEAMPDPDAALAPATNGEFRILLQHRPHVDCQDVAGTRPSERVDLQLSGHTHGGVAPGIAQVVKRFNGGMARGVSRGEDGRTVYVSAGAGQWAGFPVRFFNDPEVAVLVLRRGPRRQPAAVR